MTTGDRIRQARKNAGLTQKELADKVGVKFSAIHKYETNMVVNLKRETIAALADALNVKPSWLMCMDDQNIEEKRKDDPVAQQHELLTQLFDQLSPEAQQLVLAQLRGIAQSQSDPGDH